LSSPNGITIDTTTNQTPGRPTERPKKCWDVDFTRKDKNEKINITAPGQWAYFARVINSFRANWYGVPVV
jgi:hypothetical protein